jgi:hypothetical protein
MSSNRSWFTNTNTNTNPASEDRQSSNPFGNMRKERNPSYGNSYSDWKTTEQKKKEEAEKNRPLTDADFPPLSTKVVVKNTMITTTAHDSTTLAERLRTAMKRQEDEVLHRRLQQEQEESLSKETVVSLSLAPTLRNRMRENTLRKDQEAESLAEEKYAWQVSPEIDSPLE